MTTGGEDPKTGDGAIKWEPTSWFHSGRPLERHALVMDARGISAANRPPSAFWVVGSKALGARAVAL
ncbi:hypothetical protein SCAR479_10430 [Seiridium cardinale]|uniref:Uncharacterized protein n=1 Tax=Seiridium cardinale TaxID=138064 RepID=A0ABR2XGF6_9PEZI